MVSLLLSDYNLRALGYDPWSFIGQKRPEYLAEKQVPYPQSPKWTSSDYVKKAPPRVIASPEPVPAPRTRKTSSPATPKFLPSDGKYSPPPKTQQQVYEIPSGRTRPQESSRTGIPVRPVSNPLPYYGSRYTTRVATVRYPRVYYYRRHATKKTIRPKKKKNLWRKKTTYGRYATR